MAKKDSAHFQNGETGCDTAFVFSCPGRIEEETHKPVSGLTGAYLNMALEYLNKKTPKKFPWPCKTHYRITNAWDRVEYYKKTKRTQADDAEITQKDNINRLFNELKGVKTVIVCGKKARLALEVMFNNYKEIGDGGKCIFVVHLSGRAFHKHYKVKGSTSAVRVLKRIKKWLDEIIDQL